MVSGELVKLVKIEFHVFWKAVKFDFVRIQVISLVHTLVYSIGDNYYSYFKVLCLSILDQKLDLSLTLYINLEG